MSEKEYIELDEAKNLLERYGAAEDALTLIDSIKADDVAQVVHGRWVNERILIGGLAEKWGYDCSNCGKTASESFAYCPNCGCKMDGE